MLFRPMVLRYEAETLRRISNVDKFLEHLGFALRMDGILKSILSSAIGLTRDLDYRVEVGCSDLMMRISKEVYGYF